MFLTAEVPDCLPSAPFPCYTVYENALSWTAARDQCAQTSNCRLAQPKTQQANDIISALLYEIQAFEATIGLSRPTGNGRKLRIYVIWFVYL